MNEWKYLEIENLPSDWFAIDIDVEYIKDGSWYPCYAHRDEILSLALHYGEKYRYRKRKPKAPSHQEILKPRFWLGDYKQWEAIRAYDQPEKLYYVDGKWHDKDWFIGRQSADIPPEAE